MKIHPATYARSCVRWLCLLSLLVALAGCSSKGPPLAELPPPPVTVSQPIERKVVD